MFRRRLHTFLLYCTAILPLPVCSCASDDSVPAPAQSLLACSSFLSVRAAAGPSSILSGDRLWLLAYEDSPLAPLDSWEETRCGTAELRFGSTGGNKIFAAVANLEIDSLEIQDIISFESLERVVCRLDKEDPDYPIMSGTCRGTAGERHSIALTPLMSRIRVKRLEYDFSMRPYRNKRLEDIRTYLTNVNATSTLLSDEASPPSEIINYGALDIGQCRAMSHPELILDESGGPCTLFCYPFSPGGDGLLGQCSTRLVIEGSIDGTTYYYPIDLGGLGIRRGGSYSFDILITRSGSLDPDTPFDVGTVRLIFEEDEWEEYENETYSY